MSIFLLNRDLWFPDPEGAHPTGVVAVGGDLSIERLEMAYRNSIFPWYSEGEPLMWWSPDPRFVLYPDGLKIRRSLRKALKKSRFEIRYDTAFEQVINYCSGLERPEQDGTWIVPEMIEAYIAFHKAGFAHSVETWLDDRLVGGLYGVAIGSLFFGESMFHIEPDASKAALAALSVRYKEAPFIDCQVENDFFISMGAVNIPRKAYLEVLRTHINKPNMWETTAPKTTAKPWLDLFN